MEVPAISTYGIQPTYCGIITSTQDALILIEACLRGHLIHASRRPHEGEREHIIRSGNVFIYEENASSIKRWTDGISWSPSRMLYNFLIYRQLEEPSGADANRRAKKSKTTIKFEPSSISTEGVQTAKELIREHIHADGAVQLFPKDPQILRAKKLTKFEVDIEKFVVGSLTDSYHFMEDGLVKKTISVACGGTTHHLVSYYSVADALEHGKLQIPSMDPKFIGLGIRHELVDGQCFRLSLEDIDPMGRTVNIYRGDTDAPVIPCSFMGVTGHLVPYYSMIGSNEPQTLAEAPQLPQSPVEDPHPRIPHAQTFCEQDSYPHQLQLLEQHPQQQCFQRLFPQQSFSQEAYMQEHYSQQLNLQQWHQQEQGQHNQYWHDQYPQTHHAQDGIKQVLNQQELNNHLQYPHVQNQQYLYQQQQYSLFQQPDAIQQPNNQLQSALMYPVQHIVGKSPLLSPNTHRVTDYSSVVSSVDQAMAPIDIMDDVTATVNLGSNFDSAQPRMEEFPALNSNAFHVANYPSTVPHVGQATIPVIMRDDVKLHVELGANFDPALETSRFISHQGQDLGFDIPILENATFAVQKLLDGQENHALPIRSFSSFPVEEFEHGANLMNADGNESFGHGHCQ